MMNKLETPGRMQKSLSSKVFASASHAEKPGLVSAKSAEKMMRKQKSASSKEHKSLQKSKVD